MAIYISGVRNLPEQVQKNKDDIEDLQTAETNLEAKINQEIADREDVIKRDGTRVYLGNPNDNVFIVYDQANKTYGLFINGTAVFSFDAVSGLFNKDVAFNGDIVVSGNVDGHSATISGNITATGDISGANASVSGDITAGGDITATGDISGDNISGNVVIAGGDISAGGDITATGDISGDNITATTDLQGQYVKATQEVITNNIATPTDSRFITIKTYDLSNNPHVLQFSGTSQELTIDGNPVNAHLYRYDIFLIFTDTNMLGGSGSFTILSSTQLNITSANIIETLYTYYNQKAISCFFEYDGGFYYIFDIEGSNLASAYFNFNHGDTATDTIDSINDFVCQETQIF